MLTDEELKFLEEELKGNGIIFESVQTILDTVPKVILDLCDDIMMEESDLGGGICLDENGKIVEYDADPKHDAWRNCMAEDIYWKVERILEKL